MGQIVIKQGDLKPTLKGTCKDADGNVIDVSGASIGFYMWDRDGNSIIDNGPVNKIDGPNGKVEYKWQSGDTETIGVYHGEFVAQFSDGEMTIPNDGFISITIEDDLQ